MRDPYRRTPQQSQSFDPTPLLECNDISHCQMARRHVCAVALVPLGLTQPDTDKELVRCCLARMQHHRSVSVQTDSRHCHGFPPLGLTRTALYLYGSSYPGRHPPSGASVSYSGQYSTLWPWQPRSCSPVPLHSLNLHLARTFVLPCHRHLQRPVARPDSAPGAPRHQSPPSGPAPWVRRRPCPPPRNASPLDRDRSVPPGSR